MGQKRGHPAIAVVGAGQWGTNHLRTWHTLGHLRVVADPDPARLALVRERYPDVEVSTGGERTLLRPDIDAVVIATPAVTHADLAVAALEAGKDVLVEKPMATSAADAEKIVNAVERTGRVLMVGHVLEYHPAFLELCRLVQQGTLGKIHYVYSHRLNFGRVRTEENALWSFAPHDLALFLRLLGPYVSEVACRGGAYLSPGVADVTLMSLAYPNGVQAHVFVSWLHPYKDHRFVVVGDRQMAVFDDTAPWAEKLRLYPHTVKWEGGRVPVADRADAVTVPVAHDEPLDAECRAFVEAIRTGTQPLTDGRHGLRVLELLEAGQRSLERGGVPVSVASADPERRTPVVHPTVSVDEGAEVGNGTRVWHYSHVMTGARIGRDCVLGQNVFVAGGVSIGNRVKIQNNVSVYAGVTLEDDVFCGPSVVFTNVVNPRAAIERKDQFRPTRVRRGASLGANSTIVCGVDIGPAAFVAAGAVVRGDVPAHTIVAGVPARPIGWICECGHRLHFDTDTTQCSACALHYHRADGSVERVPAGEK